MTAPILFARVDQFEPASRGQNGRLHLVGGAVVELLPHHPMYALWADLIRLSQETRRPLYVETVPDSPIVANIQLAHKHTVLSVGLGEQKDQHEVICLPCPSPYLLSGDNPRRAELLTILRTAREARTPMWVTAHPHTREILDARPWE
jgi:hypothetical protein